MPVFKRMLAGASISALAFLLCFFTLCNAVASLWGPEMWLLAGFVGAVAGAMMSLFGRRPPAAPDALPPSEKESCQYSNAIQEPHAAYGFSRMRDFDLKPAADIGLTPGQRLQSPKRESGLLQTIGHGLFALTVRTYLHLWHRLEVHGRENLPGEPPFVIVANHASHLDALVVGAPVPLALRDRVFPLAAGDVFFESAAVSVFAAGFINALPLWRRRSTPRALQELRQRLLDEPCAYILFPEGGRTRDGSYLRFKPGVGMLVAGTDAPIIPCHLSGTFEACPAGIILPRPHKIVLRVGEPLRFPSVPNTRDGWQTVITQVEAAIRKLGETRSES